MSIRIPITADTADLRRHLRFADRRLGRFRRKISKQSVAIQKALHFTVAIGGIAAATAGMTRLNDAFRNYQDEMLGVQAKTKASDDQIKALGKRVTQVAAATRYTGGEVAQAATYLAQTGYSIKEVYDALEPVVHLATAADEDLGRMADIATNIAVPFRVAAAELSNVTDILAKAASVSNTSVGQIGEAMKYAAPVALDLGMSLEETAAAMALMAKGGIKASQAGTALRSVMVRLSRGGSEEELQLAKMNGTMTAFETVVQKLGLRLRNESGELRAFPEILKDIWAAGASAEDFATIFGGRHFTSLKSIGIEGAAGWDKMVESMRTAAGEGKKQAETRESGLGGARRNLASRFEALRIDMAQSGFAEFEIAMIGKLKSAIAAARPYLILIAQNIQEIIAKFGALVLTLAKVYVAWKVFRLLRLMVMATTAQVLRLRLALAAAAVTGGRWGTAMALSGKKIGGAISGLPGRMRRLNGAMLGGVRQVGVASVAATGKIRTMNAAMAAGAASRWAGGIATATGTVRKSLISTIARYATLTAGAIAAGAAALLPFLPVIAIASAVVAAILWIIGNWDALSGAIISAKDKMLSWFPSLDQIKEIWTKTWHGIRDVFVNVFSKIRGAIPNWMLRFFGKAKDAASDMAVAVGDGVGDVVDKVQALGLAAKNALAETDIAAGIGRGFDAVKTAADDAKGSVMASANQLIGGVGASFDGLVAKIAAGLGLKNISGRAQAAESAYDADSGSLGGDGGGGGGGGLNPLTAGGLGGGLGDTGGGGGGLNPLTAGGLGGSGMGTPGAEDGGMAGAEGGEGGGPMAIFGAMRAASTSTWGQMQTDAETGLIDMEEKLTALAAMDKQTAEQQVAHRRAQSKLLWGSLSGLLAEGAKTSKKIGKMMKAVRLADTIISTHTGIGRAMAEFPYPKSLVVAGLVAAKGLLSIRAIKSQKIGGTAHGGLDFVPDTATYLLKKGEAVIQPSQNLRLQKFLNSQSGGFGAAASAGDAQGLGQGQAVVQLNLPAGDTSAILTEEMVEMINEKLMEVQRGGGYEITDPYVT